VALRSSQSSQKKSSEELEELLDILDKLLDRTKIMYEQYFLGIQKVAPAQLHRDIERKVRELTQEQIKNTGLRFRFNTLCQKYGAYNSYWKRTIRRIEQGTYHRDIARLSREALRNGDAIPEELLAAMPKRLRDRVMRDREALASRNARQSSAPTVAATPDTQDSGRVQVHRIGTEESEALESLLSGDSELEALFDNLVGAEPRGKPPAVDLVTPPARHDAPLVPRSASTLTRSPPPAPPGSPVDGRRTLRATPPPPPEEKSGAERTKTSIPPPIPKPAPPSQSARKPRAAAQPPSAAGLPPGMTEQQCKELYKRYLHARELVGERTEMSYDRLMRTLCEQAPKIMREHRASGVDFNVVIKGEKVVLKAKPVK
jgi:hypothetical protein